MKLNSSILTTTKNYMSGKLLEVYSSFILQIYIESPLQGKVLTVLHSGDLGVYCFKKVPAVRNLHSSGEGQKQAGKKSAR